MSSLLSSAALSPGSYFSLLPLLCEELSLSQEESSGLSRTRLIELSDYFLNTLNDSSIDGDFLLLSARCLLNLLEGFPSFTPALVERPAFLEAIKGNLINIQYIDVAECILTCVERLSVVRPLPLLRFGLLSSCLSFLPFFPLSAQRCVLRASFNMTKIIPRENFDQIAEIFPCLPSFFDSCDDLIISSLLSLLCNFVKNFSHHSEALENLIALGLPKALMTGLKMLVEEPALFSGWSSLVLLLLGSLATVARKSSRASAEFLEGQISDSLKRLSENSHCPLEALLSFSIELFPDSSYSRELKNARARVKERPGQQENTKSPAEAKIFSINESSTESAAPSVSESPNRPSASNAIREQKLIFLKENPALSKILTATLLPIFLRCATAENSAKIRVKCFVGLERLIEISDSAGSQLRPAQLSAILAAALSASDTALVSAALTFFDHILTRFGSDFRQHFIREGLLDQVDGLSHRLEAPGSPASANSSPVVSTHSLMESAQSLLTRHFSDSCDAMETIEEFSLNDSGLETPNKEIPTAPAFSEAFRKAQALASEIREILAAAETPDDSFISLLCRLRTLLSAPVEEFGLTSHELLHSGILQALLKFLHEPRHRAASINDKLTNAAEDPIGAHECLSAEEARFFHPPSWTLSDQLALDHRRRLFAHVFFGLPAPGLFCSPNFPSFHIDDLLLKFLAALECCENFPCWLSNFGPGASTLEAGLEILSKPLRVELRGRSAVDLEHKFSIQQKNYEEKLANFNKEMENYSALKAQREAEIAKQQSAVKEEPVAMRTRRGSRASEEEMKRARKRSKSRKSDEAEKKKKLSAPSPPENFDPPPIPPVPPVRPPPGLVRSVLVDPLATVESIEKYLLNNHPITEFLEIPQVPQQEEFLTAAILREAVERASALSKPVRLKLRFRIRSPAAEISLAGPALPRFSSLIEVIQRFHPLGACERRRVGEFAASPKEIWKNGVEILFEQESEEEKREDSAVINQQTPVEDFSDPVDSSIARFAAALQPAFSDHSASQPPSSSSSPLISPFRGRLSRRISFASGDRQAASSLVPPLILLLHALFELSSGWRFLYPHAISSVAPIAGLPSPASFVSAKLSRKLVEHCEDPLMVCGGIFPAWLNLLTESSPFLFSYDSRQFFFRVSAFTASRHVFHLFQRFSASPAFRAAQTRNSSQRGQAEESEARESWRRVEDRDGSDSEDSHAGELNRSTGSEAAGPAFPASERLVTVKVKVHRGDPLSALKELFSHSGPADLFHVRAEFFGEEGFGSGPTEEFFVLAAREFQTCENNLWWDGERRGRQRTEEEWREALVSGKTENSCELASGPAEERKILTKRRLSGSPEKANNKQNNKKRKNSVANKSGPEEANEAVESSLFGRDGENSTAPPEVSEFSLGAASLVISNDRLGDFSYFPVLICQRCRLLEVPFCKIHEQLFTNRLPSGQWRCGPSCSNSTEHFPSSCAHCEAGGSEFPGSLEAPAVRRLHAICLSLPESQYLSSWPRHFLAIPHGALQCSNCLAVEFPGTAVDAKFSTVAKPGESSASCLTLAIGDLCLPVDFRRILQERHYRSGFRHLMTNCEGKTLEVQRILLIRSQAEKIIKLRPKTPVLAQLKEEMKEIFTIEQENEEEKDDDEESPQISDSDSPPHSESESPEPEVIVGESSAPPSIVSTQNSPPLTASAESSVAFVNSPFGIFPSPQPQSTRFWSTNSERSAEYSRQRDLFRLFGRFLGHSLLDDRLVDLNLSRPLMKILAGRELAVRDLFFLDVDMGRSMRKLWELVEERRKGSMSGGATLDGESIDSLGLEFAPPGYPGVPLSDNNPPEESVTVENLPDFVRLVGRFFLQSSVSWQTRAIVEGLSAVCQPERLKLFSVAELERLFSGSRLLDFSLPALNGAVKFKQGITQEAMEIHWLFEVLAQFQPEEQRKFLKFVTGAPSLPGGNLKSLNPPLTIARSGAGAQALPTTMTCQHLLKLPNYPDKETLVRKLTQAISEGQNGFLLS